MTISEIKDWLKAASNKELLEQLYSLKVANRFGVNNEYINLTEAEILSRMGGGKKNV